MRISSKILTLGVFVKKAVISWFLAGGTELSTELKLSCDSLQLICFFLKYVVEN